MSVINTLIHVKDSSGAIHDVHPKTTIENVSGLQTALDGKVNTASGKGLSSNDYTTAEKNKLSGIAAGAQVNSITGVKGNSESSYRTGNVNLTAANIGAAASSHTHKYAGSGSAGGAATSANKLNVGSSNIGSTTQPVYFNASTGLPVATTYSLAKSVPADAKFTDTTYSAATQSVNGLMSSTDKTKLDGVAAGATANIGTVTQVKVGTSAYNPSSGVVSLPAYPTSLPASDVYSWAKASSKPTYTASEVGLGNVGNFKAVSTVANQGLSSTEKSNARANIGAGTSSFSGSYNDLSNKPMIPTKTSQLTNDSGYITDTTVSQNIANATLYARRNGRTVTVNGFVDNLSLTAGNGTLLGTINDEIGKPPQQIRAVCSVGPNAYSFGESSYIAIAPDGNVVATPKTYTGTGAVFFSVSYTI